VITVVQVHMQGRFGNNLFQYATGRALAEKYGAELQVTKPSDHGPWIGPEVFEDAGAEPFNPKLSPRDPQILSLRGYFQDPGSTAQYTRAQVRKWFSIKPEFRIEKRTDWAYPQAAYHLRHGDFKTEPSWCVVTEESYRQFAACMGLKLEQFVKVCGETPHTDRKLPPHLQLMVDFQILTRANVLLRANSTFSWWAAVLGNGSVYSPRVTGKTGLSFYIFEYGNHCSLLSDPSVPDMANPPE